MNRTSQWLFEAPFISERDHDTNPYNNPEYYTNSEWESPPPPPCPGISKPIRRERILKVPFKKDFEDFLRGVERAVGRWTVFRSDRGQRVRRLLKPWIENIRRIHKSNLDAKVRSGVSIDILVDFFYAGKGESLRVCGLIIWVALIITGDSPE
jgi:hypothetical protein